MKFKKTTAASNMQRYIFTKINMYHHGTRLHKIKILKKKKKTQVIFNIRNEIFTRSFFSFIKVVLIPPAPTKLAVK